MTDDELKNLFYDFWSTEITTCQLINAMQSAPRPEKPYATVDLVLTTPEGQRDEQLGIVDSGSPTTMQIRGFRKALLQINIFGDEANEVVESVRQSLSKETVLDEYFRDNQVAVVSVSAARDLSFLLETKFERRLFLEIALRYGQEYTDDVGAIQTVIVNADEYNLE